MRQRSLRQLPAWAIALLLVAAAHIALGALVLGWRSPVSEPEPAIAIQLAPLPVSPVPAATPAVIPPAPTKPALEPAPPRPAAQKPSVEKAPRLLPTPPATTTAAPSEPATAAAPPALKAPARMQPHSHASSQAAISWQQRLLVHLARHKRYPEQARRRGVQGSNALKLLIDGTGRVERFALVSTSGSASLDRATLQMIRRAQPLPPPPAALLEEGRVEVVAPVSYTLDKR